MANLNKDQIIDQALAACYKYDFSKMILSHGSALCVAGLIETTGDIDAHVPEREFDKLRKIYPTIDLTNEVCLMSISETIDIHCGPGLMNPENELVYVKGKLYYRNLQTTYNDYLKLGREKDQHKLALISSILHA